MISKKIYKGFDASEDRDTPSNSNPLSYDRGLIMRSRAKRMKEAIIVFVQENLERVGQGESTLMETKSINLVNCVQANTHPFSLLHGLISSTQNSQ